jgi:ribosomal protein L11 methyltransferase
MKPANLRIFAMTLSQLSAPLTKDQAYALVDAVSERDDLAVTASAHENEETGEWVFEATCLEEPSLDAFNELARQVLGGTVEFSVEAIDPTVNWVAKSLEGLQPVIAGGFIIHGSHDADKVPAGAQAILIDAAQAFGTGHHETTTGCLEAIHRVLKRQRPKNPIDIGTGTGVLAIALAKRLRLPVIASDIDPIAVTTTVENAQANGVARLIHAVEATGLDHSKIIARAPFDLVVANILAGPLVSLAPDVNRLVTRGTSIILSGILLSQAPRVVAAYARLGMVVRFKIMKKEWATLALEKL